MRRPRVKRRGYKLVSRRTGTPYPVRRRLAPCAVTPWSLLPHVCARRAHGAAVPRFRPAFHARAYRPARLPARARPRPRPARPCARNRASAAGRDGSTAPAPDVCLPAPACARACRRRARRVCESVSAAAACLTKASSRTPRGRIDRKAHARLLMPNQLVRRPSGAGLHRATETMRRPRVRRCDRAPVSHRTGSFSRTSSVGAVRGQPFVSLPARLCAPGARVRRRARPCRV